MADAENKEVETSDLETIKKQLETVTAELEYQKAESKKAFEKRDAYKKQIEEAEKKALEEQGKYKELYEAKEKEFSELNKSLEDIKKEKEEAVNKMTAWETAQRDALTKNLSEDEKEIAAKLSLDELGKYVKLLGKSKTDEIKTVKQPNNKPKSVWQSELSNINPKAYNFSDMFKK